MSTFNQLASISDIRDLIPRATWSIGTRRDTLYFVLHYNGPAVAGFGYPRAERDQMIADARYHMRPGALGAASGGDGLQYHGGTFSDGTNWQFRDWTAQLWHCGHAQGNAYGLSWHVPLGGTQQPTAAQRAAVLGVIDAARQTWPGITVLNVRGHKEFKATACPGEAMAIVTAYRSGSRAPTGAVQPFVTTYKANVRTAPAVTAPIAAVWPAGHTFGVTRVIEDGGDFKGVRTWVRTVEGWYVHLSACRSA